MLTPSRRLHRSADDRMIAGVCGGLAETFGIDATLLRLLVGLLIIGTGFGALVPLFAIYALLAFVLPLGSESDATDAASQLEAVDAARPITATNAPVFTPEEVDAWDLAKAGVTARAGDDASAPHRGQAGQDG